MSYLDNMKFMLATFSSLYTIALDFMQCINAFEGEAYVKQNDKDIVYKFLNFDLQHEILDCKGEIYYTGDYDISKLNIKFIDKVEGNFFKVYMSLLPYDKSFKPLNIENRESIAPKDLEKIIH